MHGVQENCTRIWEKKKKLENQAHLNNVFEQNYEIMCLRNMKKKSNKTLCLKKENIKKNETLKTFEMELELKYF